MIRLREIREKKGVLQKEISSYLGIKVNTYSNYENGVRKLPIDYLTKISKFYDVSCDYLLGLIDDPISPKDYIKGKECLLNQKKNSSLSLDVKEDLLEIKVKIDQLLKK